MVELISHYSNEKVDVVHHSLKHNPSLVAFSVLFTYKSFFLKLYFQMDAFFVTRPVTKLRS